MLFPSHHRQFQIARHLICWSLYIIYEQAVYYYSMKGLEPVFTSLYFYLTNILLFYAQVYILERTLLCQPRRYLKAAGLTVLALLLSLSTKMLGESILVFPSLPAGQRALLFKQFLTLDFIRCINFAGLATLFWSASHLGDYQRQTAKAKLKELAAEKDKADLKWQLAESQNAYLRQQLNPHLLFNTLNFIYSSVSPYSKDGGECVLLLVDIMRYITDGADEDGMVLLQAEMDQVRNLMKINAYRYQQELQIKVEVKGDLRTRRIIPLVLLTLTENIFKHGIVKSPDRPARLSVIVDEQGNLTYHCSNYKKHVTNFQRKSAIGLHHLRTRLNHHYPGRHQWTINDQADHYALQLKISL